MRKKQAPKKQAFSYIRMSTEQQLKGDSLRRQLSKTREYAQKHGYEFCESFEDKGVSAFKGKNLKDGELGRFREALKSGTIDANNTVLLVESLDRLSRENVMDAVVELNSFLTTGITIITTIDGQEYTKESISKSAGILFLAVGTMLRAHDESKTKSDRLQESWKNKRSKLSNNKITSRVPSWLKLDKKTNNFLPSSSTAYKTIEDIFLWCTNENMGVNSITKRLNDNIVTYPKFNRSKSSNKYWIDSYVKKILHNKAVYGEFQPHKMLESGKRESVGKPAENYFPTIVTREIFLQAQAMMKKRSTGGAGRKGIIFPNIFKNIAKCGSCGASMRFVDKGTPPKGGKYLHCSNSIHRGGCTSPSWEYEELEKSFLGFVSEIQLHDIFDADKSKSIAEELIKSNDIEKEILLEKTKTQKVLLKLIKSGELVPSAKKDATADYNSVSNEIDAIETKIYERNIEISLIESEQQKLPKIDFSKEFSAAIKKGGDEDIYKIRSGINSKIKIMISKMSINNNPNIAVYETVSSAPQKLLEELKKKKLPFPETKYKKLTKQGLDAAAARQEDLEKYLTTEHGNRLLNKSLRTYDVIFKSGAMRTVCPYDGNTYLATDHKMAAFIEKATRNKSKSEDIAAIPPRIKKQAKPIKPTKTTKPITTKEFITW